MAGRWRALGGACHLSGPVGSVEIAEVPFTSNRKNPVNIQLFNNPECAAHGAFWRLWGLHFPLMYFHCQTLYLKSSKMELVTFSLFSFIQSNLKGFQQYFSSPRCFVVWGERGDIQVGSSSPLGFLSLGNGTPGDLGKDVTDKIYIFYVPCLLKHQPRRLDCSNLVPFTKVRNTKTHWSTFAHKHAFS